MSIATAIDSAFGLFKEGGKRKTERQAQRHEFRMEKLRLKAEIAKARAQSNADQAQLNLADAKSGSLFKGGWRPFIGWTCGIALFYHFLIFSLFAGFVEHWWGVEMVDVEFDEISTLVVGLLGMASIRGYEKVQERKNQLQYGGQGAAPHTASSPAPITAGQQARLEKGLARNWSVKRMAKKANLPEHVVEQWLDRRASG